MSAETDSSKSRTRQLPAQALTALQRNNKIQAIKIVREEHGIGLKEAKEFVEEYIDGDVALQAQMRANAPQVSGGQLMRLLSVAALVVVLVLWWMNS